MKNRVHLSILSLTASIIFSAGLLAQEQIEVTIQVKKDGKIIKDTTYQFDDASEAKHAVKMMEVLSGDEPHMEHSGSNHSKVMVFIFEDGEKTEIKEFHGDSLVWVTEGEADSDNVKVMKYKIKEGEHPHGEHVIVMKNDDGVEVEIEKIMVEHGDAENVKVIVVKKKKKKENK